MCHLLFKGRNQSAVIVLKDILVQLHSRSTFQTMFSVCLMLDNLNSETMPTCVHRLLLRASWYSMTLKGEQSLGADHHLTATSMNKAVRASCWGIGIVSGLIKRGEWIGGGEGRGGSVRALTWCPDSTVSRYEPNLRLCLSLVCTAVIESERERQVFSGNQIWTFVNAAGTKRSRRRGSRNYLHIITCFGTAQGELTVQISKISGGRATHGWTLTCFNNDATSTKFCIKVRRTQIVHGSIPSAVCLLMYRQLTGISNTSLYFTQILQLSEIIVQFCRISL